MPIFAIAPASLHRLRRRLDASGEGVAATILQEAGFATGEAMHERWRNRVAERTGLDDAGHLDVRWFGPMLDELCIDLGWGSVSVTTLDDSALLLEAGNWAEAEPASSTIPSCHFSCGCLAAFLTAQAGAPIAVLEVECRSRGDDACRFLGASTASLAVVYDLIAAGRSWREAYDING
jgi:predicted hydrocarbon binding protein